MAINRKDFLKSLGGLAALTIIPRHVLGGPGHIAPNDQLTKGIIGMGGIGFSANHFSSNEQCRLVANTHHQTNHHHTPNTPPNTQNPHTQNPKHHKPNQPQTKNQKHIFKFYKKSTNNQKIE